MDVRNCRGCGKLFNYVQGMGYLCPSCMDKLEKKFEGVKKYIRENPRATMPEIAEATETTVQQLERWVREERLVFSDDSPVGIQCENCGAIIKTGRFCAKCKDEMQKNLSSVYKENKPQIKPRQSDKDRDKERMRFLNKNSI